MILIFEVYYLMFALLSKVFHSKPKSISIPLSLLLGQALNPQGWFRTKLRPHRQRWLHSHIAIRQTRKTTHVSNQQGSRFPMHRTHWMQQLSQGGPGGRHLARQEQLHITSWVASRVLQMEGGEVTVTQRLLWLHFRVRWLQKSKAGVTSCEASHFLVTTQKYPWWWRRGSKCSHNLRTREISSAPQANIKFFLHFQSQNFTQLSTVLFASDGEPLRAFNTSCLWHTCCSLATTALLSMFISKVSAPLPNLR